MDVSTFSLVEGMIKNYNHYCCKFDTTGHPVVIQNDFLRHADASQKKKSVGLNSFVLDMLIVNIA
jgi:hypothetical protein